MDDDPMLPNPPVAPVSFELTYQSFPTEAGPLYYARVPWDSQLYGFPFYELRCRDVTPEDLREHLADLLLALRTNTASLVYAKIPTWAVALGQVLTTHGFYPVETLLQLYLPLARYIPFVPRQAHRANLRLATEADLPRLGAIARSAFSADRLHLDPNLPPEKADQRFAEWVERGLRANELIFVYQDRATAETIAFLHAREIGSKTVDLSLSAVDAGRQRMGVGVAMYQAVLEACRDRGYRIATTRVSLNNLAVINLCTRLNFTCRDAVVTLHRFQPLHSNDGHDRLRHWHWLQGQ